MANLTLWTFFSICDECSAIHLFIVLPHCIFWVSNCHLSLHLNIAVLRQHPGKMFWGSWKSPGFFWSKSGNPDGWDCISIPVVILYTWKYTGNASCWYFQCCLISSISHCCVGNIWKCSSHNEDTIFNKHNDKLRMSAGGLHLLGLIVVYCMTDIFSWRSVMYSTV